MEQQAGDEESWLEDEYEYYTDTENEADGVEGDDEDEDKDTVKDIPVRYRHS